MLGEKKAVKSLEFFSDHEKRLCVLARGRDRQSVPHDSVIFE